MAISVDGAGTGITVGPESIVLANPGRSVSAVRSVPVACVNVLTFAKVVYRLDPAA